MLVKTMKGILEEVEILYIQNDFIYNRYSSVSDEITSEEEGYDSCTY